MLIGFKRIKIQPLDTSGLPDGDLIVLEGKQDCGATQEAGISGLSTEPVKVWGSNGAYYVSQKGTGDVKVTLKLLDVPDEAEAIMLGYNRDMENGIQLIGENTEPPYCAIILESEDTKGNIAMFGFFKGKFSKGDFNLKTKEGSSFSPEGENYTYSAVMSDREDKTKGNSMAKYLGTKEKQAEVEATILGTGV